MPLDISSQPRKPQFLYPAETFVNIGAERNWINRSLTVETARDTARQIQNRQQPMDFIWHSQTLMVGFDEGRPALVHICGELQGEKLFFTVRGWQMFCDFALVNVGQRKSIEFQGRSDRGIRLKRDPEGKGPEVESPASASGRALAALQINWFLTNYAKHRNIRLRTVLKKNHRGQMERVIRHVATPTYTPFDELDYLNLILDSEPELGKRPVLKYRQGDSGMFLRILDQEDIDFSKGTQILSRDFWNSPVSLRRVGQGDGLMNVLCTNGMMSHEKGANIELYHRGDEDEIRRAIVNHSEESKARRDGLLDRYQRAVDVVIEDAYGWMESMMLGLKQPATTIDRVRNGMRDPTSNPIGSLAGIADGITLIAQDNSFDIFDQWELERAASKVLTKGLNAAIDGVIHAPKKAVITA